MPAPPLHRRMLLARQYAEKSDPELSNPVNVCLRIAALAGKPFGVDELEALEQGRLPATGSWCRSLTVTGCGRSG